MRVAVTQFTTTLNSQENLNNCIHMINEVSACKPSLILFPLYCNTHFLNNPFNGTPIDNMGHTNLANHSYKDHNQAWNDALNIDDVFMQKIAKLAKSLQCYILINVTLRQDDSRPNNDPEIKSNISVTTCIFSPQGVLASQQHKSTLTPHEKQFFTPITSDNETVTTSVGNIGLLTGNDSLCFTTSHKLVCAGANILCNVMDQGSKDQTDYHDPTRASENNVYLLAANKVSQANELRNPSQIISPQGRVVSQVNTNHDGYTYADIELPTENIKDKLALKAEVLGQKSFDFLQSPSAGTEAYDAQTPSTSNVAIFATYKSNEEAIDDVCHYIENNLSEIIQLPELFFIADKSILNNSSEREKVEQLSQHMINKVSSVLGPYQYVCTSLIINGQHQAVVINSGGLFALQAQLSFCNRYSWASLTKTINVITLPLEQGCIKLAMLTANDANIAEIIKAVCLQGIQLLLVPFDIQEPSEVKYKLISRAIEHNICVVAASREKSFNDNLIATKTPDTPFAKNKIKVHKSTGLIINLMGKPQQLPQWKKRKFIGFINEPIIKAQFGKITKAVIHPLASG